MIEFLDFEAPVAEFEGKIAGLKAMAQGDGKISIADDVRSLEKKSAKALADLYQNLTPWQKAQVARHAQRPHALDYIGALIADFVATAAVHRLRPEQHFLIDRSAQKTGLLAAEQQPCGKNHR